MAWEWRKEALYPIGSSHPVLYIDHDVDGRPYIEVSDEHAALIAEAPEMHKALTETADLLNDLLAEFGLSDAYVSRIGVLLANGVEPLLRKLRGEGVE